MQESLDSACAGYHGLVKVREAVLRVKVICSQPLVRCIQKHEREKPLGNFPDRQSNQFWSDSEDAYRFAVGVNPVQLSSRKLYMVLTMCDDECRRFACHREIEARGVDLPLFECP